MAPWLLAAIAAEHVGGAQRGWSARCCEFFELANTQHGDSGYGHGWLCTPERKLFFSGKSRSHTQRHDLRGANAGRE
jgi:hypothetical protein